MTGVSKGAILRLLVSVGDACADYQNAVIRNISAKRVQVDEIWSFCYAKQKNVTLSMARERVAGDVWTFTAIDADTKLVISWLVGRRDAGCAAEFLRDVAARLSNRIQLTADGHKMYLDAVPDAFGNDIDFAQLVKVYGSDPEGQTRYSQLVDATQTDNDGHFELKGVPEGTYRLVAKYEGLSPANAKLRIQRSRSKKSLIIQMRPAGLDTISFVELK